MKAVLVAEFGVMSEINSPRCLTDGSWQVQTSDTRLVVLDGDLRTVRRAFEFPEAGHSAVRLDMRYAAVSGSDRIVLVDESGKTVWQIIHPKWPTGYGGVGGGSCAFSCDGDRLWAVVPSGSREDDEWWVLDTASGRVLDRAPLGCRFIEGSFSLNHPDGQHVGIDLSIPYYGWIGWGHWTNGRAAVTARDAPAEVLSDIPPCR